jgi:hypothetical protein
MFSCHGIDRMLHDTILTAPSAHLTIKTSFVYYSETFDDIEITFVGDASSSGPHAIGAFPDRGRDREIYVSLDRYIGALQHILFQNRGFNGFLPSRVSCILNGNQYSFTVPRIWINSFNNTGFILEGDGFEPRVQQAPGNIPSAPVVKYEIAETLKINTRTGNGPYKP